MRIKKNLSLKGRVYGCFLEQHKINFLPGPTPRTVLDPGAICVLPASFIRQTSKPIDLPFRARSTLQTQKPRKMSTEHHNIMEYVSCVFDTQELWTTDHDVGGRQRDGVVRGTDL